MSSIIHVSRFSVQEAIACQRNNFPNDFAESRRAKLIVKEAHNLKIPPMIELIDPRRWRRALCHGGQYCYTNRGKTEPINSKPDQ